MALFFCVSAEAGELVTVTQASRSIWVDVVGEGMEYNIETSEDLGPFVALVDAFEPTPWGPNTATASQDSFIGAASFSSMGGASADVTVLGAGTAEAYSGMIVFFELAEPAAYTLSGTLSGLPNQGAVGLTRGSDSVWYFTNVELDLTLNESGVLEAGSYVFGVTSWFLTMPFGEDPYGTHTHDVTLQLSPAAPSFCDEADGSLAFCPCSNPGLPDTGCDIQQSTGGVALGLVAQETSPENRVTWQGTGFPTASTPASIVIRAAELDSGAPVVFGDGLRCIGTPLVRLSATFASGGGVTHAHGHGAMAGSGDFAYQLWFRNTPAMYCTPDAFNLSNGRTLTW